MDALGSLDKGIQHLLHFFDVPSPDAPLSPDGVVIDLGGKDGHRGSHLEQHRQPSRRDPVGSTGTSSHTRAAKTSATPPDQR